jgi:hypothetical protein
VSRPREGSKPTSACLAGLIASLLIVGQLAGAAHLVLVHHEVCPIDGELVHAGGGQHSAAHRAVGVAPAVFPSEAAEDHHGHEHCILASHRRSATLRNARVTSHAPPRVVLTSSALERAPRPSGAALLLVAPKQSPPV